MGVYICPTHGKTGISLACVHIDDDLRAQRPIRPFRMLFFGKVGSLPIHYCDGCAQERFLPASGTIIPDELWCSKTEAWRYDATGVCGKCFQVYSANPWNNGAVPSFDR